jgi:bacteriorhodopsin
MNPWDVVTWLSSIVLAVSAVVIFVFFLRDARSILNREMHGHEDEDEDAEDSPEPDATSGSPDDLPR